MKSPEHQAREKVRAATRMLADATSLYEAAGLAYQRPCTLGLMSSGKPIRLKAAPRAARV